MPVRSDSDDVMKRQPVGTPAERDRATVRLVAGGIVAALLTLTGVVVLDVAFSYLHPIDGNAGTHLPTEVWMVLAALIGVMGGFLGGRRQDHPEQTVDDPTPLSPPTVWQQPELIPPVPPRQRGRVVPPSDPRST